VAVGVGDAAAAVCVSPSMAICAASVRMSDEVSSSPPPHAVSIPANKRTKIMEGSFILGNFFLGSTFMERAEIISS
jgi:hypothetical protein